MDGVVILVLFGSMAIGFLGGYGIAETKWRKDYNEAIDYLYELKFEKFIQNLRD